MKLTGKISGAGEGYKGHSVAIDGWFRTGAADQDIRLNFNTETADDGSFLLELPEGTEPAGKLEVELRAPSGTRLTRAEGVEPGRIIRLRAKPQLPVQLSIRPDPLALSLGDFRLRVTLHDTVTNAPAAARLAALWAVRASADGGDDLRTIVAAEYTDSTGVARLSFARAAYKSLEIELTDTVGGATTASVDLDANGLPASEMRLSAAFPEQADHDHDDDDEGDCACESTSLPRAPDHADLTEPGSPFSTDLQGGTCPSPAVPNRTIEEYRYYSLVRTTDPFLFGVKPKAPKPLAPWAIDALGTLAYGYQSYDESLVPQQTDAVVEGYNALDHARAKSEEYMAGGHLAARGWRDSTGNTEEIQKEIQARAANLSEETLMHALADPDGFTPVALMTSERLAAAQRIEERFRFLHDASKGRELVSDDNPINWDRIRPAYQAATVAHGHMLEWRQVWRADGYSLGDLLYSLPLAPGQKRKISVIDWDRQESTVRRESRRFSESLDAELSRNRTVSEVVNSVVTESISAGSNANTWAAGGGIGLGIPFNGGFFGLGVGGGGGGASSSAWQNASRSVAASAGQQLTDRLAQASSAVRSQKATVVVGERQREGLAITAEVVANYNHCHAMTMEYFEVLQHFRVDHELAHVRECLFVPMHIRPFDEYKALRWRDNLRRYLRDRRLAGGFGAIDRILSGYANVPVPAGRYADEPITELSGELRLELDIARPRDPHEGEAIQDYLDSAWDFWQELFGNTSAQKTYDASRTDAALSDRIFADQFAPRVASAFCNTLEIELVYSDPVTGVERSFNTVADMTMVSDYRAGRQHLVTFRATRLPANVTRAMIKAVRVKAKSGLDSLSPNSRTILRRADVVYSNAFRRHRLVRNRWMRDDVLEGDFASFPTRVLSRSEQRNPRATDLSLKNALLRHLNEFVEHYHQVIWWRMDPGRRFMLLDGFFAPGSGGRSLASVVENRLINIVGNCLVLPVAAGYQLDPGLKRVAQQDGDMTDLLELYRPPVPIPPRRVSLPTRGVHAEAILGACNSCETRDDTRFWDWSSEKIPGNEPPEISETGTGTRRQAPPDTTPSDFPAPVVAIQNAPTAPDPTSINALAGLLGTEGLFKDFTGLEGNQKNAIEAFKASLSTADAFGKMAVSGAKSSFANRESDRVMRKIKEAEKSGLLKKKDAKDVVAKLFDVVNGETGEADTPLTEEKTVKEALKEVNEAKGAKKVSVTSKNGSGEQKVEVDIPETPAKPLMNLRLDGAFPVQQPSSNSCWATALTMMRSYRDQASYDFNTILAEGGQRYLDLFASDTALPVGEVGQFRNDFGLRDAGVGVISAESIKSAMTLYGPLWVVIDQDPSTSFSLHAVVITGIVGDGTATGTTVYYNDPATGKEESATVKVLSDQINQFTNGFASTLGGSSPLILALGR